MGKPEGNLFPGKPLDKSPGCPHLWRVLPRTFVAGVVALAAAWSVIAQDAGESALDATKVLPELEAIKARHAQERKRRFDALAASLLAASKSNDAATRVYSDALRDVDYSAGGDDTKRFMQWREQNKDLLTKDKNFGLAARFQLRYLALSLARIDDPKSNEVLQQTWNYAKDLAIALAENGDEFVQGGGALLGQPLTSSPIARAKRVDADLQNLTDWEMSAGALEGILENNLRARLRELKDPRLLETWKMEIGYRQARAEKSRSELVRANFQQVELPRILWRQSQDMLVLGQRDGGLAEMLRIVRNNPGHPDVALWVEGLTGALDPVATPTPGVLEPG